MNNDKSSFLGTDKIFPLLIKMGAPAAAGMLVQALYNIVDTIFVGRGVGPEAIGALSIVFPIQMTVSSIAMALGIGTASIVSRRLGENKPEEASAAVGSGFTWMLAGTIVLIVFLSIFTKPVLRFFGSTENLIPLSMQYTKYVIPGFFFFAFATFANNLFRSEGNAKAAMTGMMLGALLNCILDPVLIIYFNLGVKGAGLATTISQAVSSVYFLSLYVRKKSTVKLSIANFRIRKDLIIESSMLGMPSFIMHAGMSLLTLIINNSLGYYGGDNAIISYGMVHKFFSIIILPMIGIAQGFQPIAGYNFGAGNYHRVREALFKAIASGFTVIFIGYTVSMLFARACMSLFASDPEILTLSSTVLRTFILVVPIASIQFIGTTYFQAVGKARQSMLLGLSRQFLILIPLIIVMPLIFGIKGIWMSFPVADVLSVAITTAFLRKELAHLNELMLQKDESIALN